MRSSAAIALFCGGAALLALACSSSSTSTSTPSGACAEYVAARREGAQACGKSSGPPDREAELDARLTKQCEVVVGAPGIGITPSALTACASKLRTSCGDEEVCGSLATAGTLPDGAACGVDSQCVSLDCVSAGGSTAPTPCGVCSPRVAIGGACGDTVGNCVKGASCSTRGTCVADPRLGEGEVCYDPSKPSSVTSSCADGLVCNGGGSATSVVKCTKPGDAGAVCTSDSDCLSALRCVNGTCAAPAPVGTACTSGSECATSACSTQTKKCVAVEWVAAGGACDSNVRRCARGKCSQSGSGAGTCIDPIPDGSACSLTATSVSAPRCDTYANCVNGTCQIFAPAICK